MDRCLYSNKSCPNPRTTKKDGSLHRLCAYHQEKANSRQKQYLMKRKIMEDRPTLSRAKEMEPPPAYLYHDEEALAAAIEPIAFDAEEATLSAREVQMLAASMAVEGEGE